MAIDLDLLFTWGAIAKEYKKNEIIISEDETAHFYYQVIDGCVRMFNCNDDGKEFTQGYFTEGQSFGEPPLFIDEKYPSTATAFQDCKIIKLSKEKCSVDLGKKTCSKSRRFQKKCREKPGGFITFSSQHSSKNSFWPGT